MTVNGEVKEIGQELMDVIASYMDDEKREAVHAEMAPCSNEEFILRYLELDPDFEELLRIEFSVEV